MAPESTSLVDCGRGRRLDRLGPFLLDRPAPAAEGLEPARPELWAQADARFDRPVVSPGSWSGPRVPSAPWPVEVEGLTFELRATSTGQVGIFLEQRPMWRWLRARSARRPMQVLNLFAHTGGSTLAAAAGGASVVHVDGARTAVSWARRNAELSGLAAAQVRWIVEDAGLFVKRELKRGHGYDAVILDPPSFGRGPKGERWRLEDQLDELLRDVAALTRGRREFVLLTTHTPGFDARRLGRALDAALGDSRAGALETGSLEMRAESGNALSAGTFARWAAG